MSSAWHNDEPGPSALITPAIWGGLLGRERESERERERASWSRREASPRTHMEAQPEHCNPEPNRRCSAFLPFFLLFAASLKCVTKLRLTYCHELVASLWLCTTLTIPASGTKPSWTLPVQLHNTSDTLRTGGSTRRRHLCSLTPTQPGLKGGPRRCIT